MRSLHHNTMSDVTAQKSHYVSFVARERCDTERSIDGIFMRWVREWAACRWASNLRSRRKSFFKHLTGAESILPCLRVISTRPLFCTGVITLHFTQPVIPWHAVTLCLNNVRPRDPSGWAWCSRAWPNIQKVRELNVWVVTGLPFSAGIRQDDSRQ